MKMKLSAIVTILSVLAFTSCKKDNNPATTNADAITVVVATAVPAAMLPVLTAAFAGATEVEWHKSNNHFEVEFNHQGQRHDCGFDDNGHQTSHDVSCTTGIVPAVVLNAFRTRNPNDNVYEWSLKGDGSWQAHFNRNAVKWEASFSSTGNFIKKSMNNFRH